MHNIIENLKNSRNILLTSHIHPDGDALGSQIAMGLALTAYGKTITFYNESNTPKMYRFLPSSDRIVHQIDSTDKYDTAVILDCSDLQRTGKIADNISLIPSIINIDHHITNTGFGTCQLIDSSACATAEIIYRLIKKMEITITRSMAFSIYTAIMTDTGAFRFSNTNKAAFSICAEMVDMGVDPNFIANHVYITYSISRIKLLSMVIESIEVSENGKMSIMELTQEMLDKTGTKREDVGRVINYARHLEDVKVAALIFESKNGGHKSPDEEREFHISLRSNGTVDVSAIATAFGGGGHMSSAGFNIKSSLTTIKPRILSLAEDF
ncbi:MAG: bifunctional oligoribonuclease/PAP phosphatase NrnA [Deltaproteobacteria bacterium]|nr:bifunctional oligoribonuclease/PAP phosphatase NrnA [Deltaproteobacteria bacterium]